MGAQNGGARILLYPLGPDTQHALVAVARLDGGKRCIRKEAPPHRPSVRPDSSPQWRAGGIAGDPQVQVQDGVSRLINRVREMVLQPVARCLNTPVPPALYGGNQPRREERG